MKNLLIITQKVDKNDQLLGFFIDWIAGFAQKFEKVTILCLEKGEFDLPKNVSVISLGKDRNLSKLFWFFNFYKYLFRYRKQYDAVFIHMNPIWVVLGSWYWHMTNKKVCLWYAHKSVTFKLRLAEKFSDIIFTSTLDGFRLDSKKVKVVGQGINTDLFKPDKSVSPAPETLINVGRIAPIKNYEPLIEAIKIIKDGGINVNLTIVGEPTLNVDFKYQEKLVKMVKDIGIEERIKFVGKITNNDLPNYYRKNKIYINLSRTGSLDKTILEAMASGCVVLSSNDSAKKFLPPRLVIRSENPNDLAEQIKEATRWDVGDELRDYVVSNHSLPELIKSMSESIKTP
ncbi:MAG: glycosyltransferase family 4 protein [Patescibacteria group bacterium]